MAMTVLNNTAAQMTLGELNKNNNKLLKDLKKVSTGAKVTAYSTNAAGIGTGQLNGSGDAIKNTINDITIYSYSSGDVVAIAENPNSEPIGKGYHNNPNVSINSINLLDRYNYKEGGAYDPLDLEIGGTKFITNSKTVYEEVEAETHPNPLIIHTGTKANQNIPIYIEDMRLDALGIKNTLINPREQAENSLDIIDKAIDYALDQATSLGAHYNELEFTESNLTTASENTISSESVIRDADIAREMTNFTKHNILSQAAQAVLSQANKDASSIVSLLQ